VIALLALIAVEIFTAVDSGATFAAEAEEIIVEASKVINPVPQVTADGS